MKKILIVDDASFVREALTSICEKAGYQVIGKAADGREAMALFREFRPDLVLLDIVMDPTDGFELIEMMKKHDLNAKIVMVTVKAQKEYQDKAISLGAAGYVWKPFTDAEIKMEIERVIGKP